MIQSQNILENSDDALLAIDTSKAIGDQINDLTNRLHNTSEELHQQIREKYYYMLQHVSCAGRFDMALNSLADNVLRFRGTGLQLQNQIHTQFELIENQTKVLGRLHELSNLLRAAGTMLTLTTKLQNTKDVLKRAELHYELSELIDDKELKDVDFVQTERAYVITSRQKIRNLTQMQLVTGLQERNEAQVVHALKIFKNFNTLDLSLENLVATLIADMDQSLKECFAGTDITVLNKLQTNISGSKSSTNLRGPGKTPQLTTTQNFRAKFWKSLHWLLYDELYESCEQIRLLKRALRQMNQFGFAEVRESIQERFWQAVQTLLLKSFAECSSHVSQTLQEGLSKLLTSALGLEQRLNGEFRFHKDIFAQLEVGYVSKCATNMKACLAGVDFPNNETIDNFIRISAGELSASLIEPQLANSIAAVFMACGKELCTKLEAQIKLGADSKQVVDTPNIQQMQNILLANILHYYKDSTLRMLQDLQEQFKKSTSTAKQDIETSLEQADLLISTILQQIIDSIILTASIIILSMHREPGLDSEKISTTEVSMYMKEFQEFITRTWTNHVEPFEDKDITSRCGQQLCKRCIDLFIHNLIILRPISKAGRFRLKNDCTHMEFALKPICSNLADLGYSARLLRAVSLLVVQQPNELVQQTISWDSLVPSYVVLFLLFGHAGVELQSPHVTANWSNERLIEWLDGHSDREKLELISGALQRYRDSVRRKKSEQYDEVYPLMVDFFEKAIKIKGNKIK